jgi:hypothetical protein
MTEILTERWKRLYDDNDTEKGKTVNKDNFDSEALEEDTMTMRLSGDLTAYDYGEFEMPKGAEIDEVSGRWGCYIVRFTDPEKYPDMEVQCDQEIDGKHPSYIIISDDEGNSHYEW